MLKKRLLWTAVIVLAVVGAATGHIDRASEEQAEDALKNALVTFAVARTLNGVISAAQGTEVALEPGGVGVVLSVIAVHRIENAARLLGGRGVIQIAVRRICN